MLVGLSRECILAVRRQKNSRVKCNWPCTSYFLCSPDPIRTLEGLTLSTLKLLWAFSLCVEDFVARLLNCKDENQDYTPAGESWGSRNPWDTSISPATSFCQNKTVTLAEVPPLHQPTLSFRVWLMRKNACEAFAQKDPAMPTNTTVQCVTWSVDCTSPQTAPNKAVREHRPCCKRDRTASPAIG